MVQSRRQVPSAFFKKEACFRRIFPSAGVRQNFRSRNGNANFLHRREAAFRVRSSLPKTFEPGRGALGVPHGVLGILRPR